MDNKTNPWTVLSKKTAYENNWIRIDHHEVLNPAGGPGIYGTVHYKAHAIGVVPLDEKGNVILVGQYRFPLEEYSWEIPEGGGHQELSILQSAQRELCEECGLAAKHWLKIQEMDLSNSVSDERGTLFLAWDLFSAEGEPEATERIETARIPFWQAVERVKRGEIRDSMSVTGLLCVALKALQNELPSGLAELIQCPAAK
jgi:8-oxo-dGTP pyrophosphatase MutT (NUDIX family)